jgi:hypothetical protein
MPSKRGRRAREDAESVFAQGHGFRACPERRMDAEGALFAARLHRLLKRADVLLFGLAQGFSPAKNSATYEGL